MRRSILACTCVALGAATLARAGEVRTEAVRFDAGASGTRIEASLKGDETVQYLLRASEGQQMTVVMTTDSDAAYFNVFEPGKEPGEDEAMFIGSTAGSGFEGSLPASGEYMIQVYQMRSAARREEMAAYTLEISIVGELGPRPYDAKVAGTDFHATGLLSCSRYEGQPMGQCEFGVKRRGTGDAELTVFWPGGGTRILVFEDGAPVSSDASEGLTATMESDLHLIRIGAERFEVPDGTIVGG